MTAPRIHLPVSLQGGATVTLDKHAARHVLRVLRLQPGDALTLFDGRLVNDRYGEYHATLLDAKGAVRIGEFVPRDTESPLTITLAQGVSRGERMDYAVQKAAELGVTRIVPLLTEFCVVKVQEERREKRLAHWRGIATSACEQSGRVRVPDIAAPLDFRAWLPTAQAAVKLVLDPFATLTLPQLPKPQGEIIVLAGPEGGLSDAEVVQAKQAGFIPARLGPRILRTETVPAAALAALQTLWGDWS
ncbi:MAG: 16S rRNA (uracil(1498)-N(3))-methyltransferase [Gammaproteobacteria bacterium]|nr:MAG: 16S rRNA (uracil(1498)-N(3))-methyltransferase [Gammaproteobacteria bacterium]